MFTHIYMDVCRHASHHLFFILDQPHLVSLLYLWASALPLCLFFFIRMISSFTHTHTHTHTHTLSLSLSLFLSLSLSICPPAYLFLSQGIGRMLLSARNTPLVVPFYVRGRHCSFRSLLTKFIYIYLSLSLSFSLSLSLSHSSLFDLHYLANLVWPNHAHIFPIATHTLRHAGRSSQLLIHTSHRQDRACTTICNCTLFFFSCGFFALIIFSP